MIRTQLIRVFAAKKPTPERDSGVRSGYGDLCVDLGYSWRNIDERMAKHKQIVDIQFQGAMNTDSIVIR